ncbi:MAG: ligase-associated DNA damage response endonuclease PdeM [Gemmatimonadaceae bacterium]|nr:ligase-associated DNA damage response endonuclease PdeM [Gemmatimonadaceae bacterium]
MTGLPPGSLAHEVAGSTVVMLPQRALWLPEHETVLVADLHWGKAAAFRAAHVPVPVGTTASDLARLSIVLESTRAQRLVVLGDLLHARSGRHADTLDVIAGWRARHAAVHMLLVRGNHDLHAGDPPPELDIACTSTPWRAGSFVGVHEPEPHTAGYVLAGHWHPHVTLRGRGRTSTRLPAFAFGTSVGILPAFSSFTGGGMYEPRPNDDLYVIADDEVLALA